jgi:hypothetical protein
MIGFGLQRFIASESSEEASDSDSECDLIDSDTASATTTGLSSLILGGLKQYETFVCQ